MQQLESEMNELMRHVHENDREKHSAAQRPPTAGVDGRDGYMTIYDGYMTIYE